MIIVDRIGKYRDGGTIGIRLTCLSPEQLEDLQLPINEDGSEEYEIRRSYKIASDTIGDYMWVTSDGKKTILKEGNPGLARMIQEAEWKIDIYQKFIKDK